jgi:hypothetical protein
MDKRDAPVVRIPKKTKTEELEDDKEKIQQMFEGDDLSGLQFRHRKNRRIDVEDIEQYIKSMDFDNVSEDELEEESGAEFGNFTKNYRMQIRETADAGEKEAGMSERTTKHSNNRFSSSKEQSANIKYEQKKFPENLYKLVPEKTSTGVLSSLLKRLEQQGVHTVGKDLVCRVEGDEVSANDAMSNYKIFTRGHDLLLVLDQPKHDPSLPAKAPWTSPESKKNKQKSPKLLNSGNEKLKRVFPDKKIEQLVSDYSDKRASSFRVPGSTNTMDEAASVKIYCFAGKAILLVFEAWPLVEHPETFCLRKMHLFESACATGASLGLDAIQSKLDQLTKNEGVHSVERFLLKIAAEEQTTTHKPCMNVQAISREVISEMDYPDVSHYSEPKRRHRARVVEFDYQDDDDFGPIGSDRSWNRDLEGSFSL